VRRKCNEHGGHDWIASQHVDKTTTVAESSGEDTTCVNTELRRDVGYKSLDEVQIVDCRVADPTRVTLPCILAHRVRDRCRVDCNTVGIDSIK
jgi:hypothetical protein